MPGSESSRQPIVATTSGAAPGLAGTWATALATLLVLAMLATLLAIVVVNAFGWFHSTREEGEAATVGTPPQYCRKVSIEIEGTSEEIRRAAEVLSGRELTPRDVEGRTRIEVPDFLVMACVVIGK